MGPANKKSWIELTKDGDDFVFTKKIGDMNTMEVTGKEILRTKSAEQANIWKLVLRRKKRLNVKDKISTFKEYYVNEKATKLDKLQLALDVAGVEPTVGTAADIANGIISGLRAAAALARKDGDAAKEHTINLGISAVSLVPFGDIVKLAKLRKLRKPLVKGAKMAKKAGVAAKADRAVSSRQKLTSDEEV